jgi:alpha-amylase
LVTVCFYFQVHQPFRLRKYNIFDIGNNSRYFDDQKNRQIMRKVAKKCYLPTNTLILNLIKRHKGKFKVSYSITGMALEQFEKYAPEVLESFKTLSNTGCVEFLCETYYHSLAYMFSKKEFREQVQKHAKKIKELFGQEPKVFRNTELIYNNELARFVETMGYKTILAEGADHILDWRSPNYIYRPKTTNGMKLLLKNYKLSDDIAFRFGNKGWKEFPLTVEKFGQWISAVNGAGDTVNLFMDYETFGEHQWEDTGIFNFMEALPRELLKHPDNNFMTVSEVAESYPVRAELDIHNFVSWADIERDMSAWLGNNIQRSAVKELYRMEEVIKKLGDKKLLEDWKKLTISDHYYYMCTKWFNDGDVHKYFNPYDTPYEAFITFMNILNDITIRIKQKNEKLYTEIADTGKIKITDKPSALVLNKV